jgi:hypothetical protein
MGGFCSLRSRYRVELAHYMVQWWVFVSAVMDFWVVVLSLFNLLIYLFH